MSQHYNHPYWPSPRAARIAKLLLKQHEPPSYLHWEIAEIWREGRPVKPEGRLTHDKALKVMADYLGLSVHEFLHIKPFDAILRLKLVDPCSFNAEEKAWRILGNTTLPVWWGGRMPCCVVCDRMLPPAPAPAPAEPPAAATVVPVRDPPVTLPAPCRETTAASTPHAPASAEARQHPPAAGAELIETLMEFLKEMNGIVTTGDQRYVTALVEQYKGRVL